jgi:WD40 repeat protein
MRLLVTPAVTLSLGLIAVAGVNAQEAKSKADLVRTDRLGDPLPDGAVARLGTLRLWQRGNIASIALSPDGKLAATGSSWLHRRTGPGSSSGSAEGRVRIWDVATGKELLTLEAPGLVFGVSFSPDSKRLAAGCGHEVRMWDAATGKLLHRLTGHQKPTAAVGFSRDGKQLFSVASDTSWGLVNNAGDDSEVIWWDAISGKKLRAVKGTPPGPKDDEGLEALAVAPDATVLLKVFRKAAPRPGAMRTLKAFDTANDRLLFQQPLSDQAEVRAMAFSADGKRYARADTVLWIEDAAKGVPVGKLERTGGSVAGLAFSPDGKQLAGSFHYGQVCLWDVAKGKLRDFKVGSAPAYYQPLPPTAVAPVFAADGRLLAAADGGTLRLWDVATAKERAELPGHRAPVFHVQYSRDGRIVITADKQRICRWDAGTGKETGQQSREGLEISGTVRAASRDGTVLLAQAAAGALELRTTAGDKVRVTLPRKDQHVQHAYFSPRGDHVIIVARAGEGAEAVVYATGSGKEIGRVAMAANQDEATKQVLSYYQEDHAPVVSADGKHLAWVGPGGRVYLGDLATGKIVRHLDANRARREKNEAVAPPHLVFSPDGRQLATVPSGGFSGIPGAAVEEDFTITLWDVASGKVRQRLRVRRDDANSALLASAAFSPDGRTLAIGTHDDGRVRLWEVLSGTERRTFAGHQAAVLALAFAPDGKALASSSDDGTALLWDVRGAEPAAAQVKSETLWADLAGEARQADRAIRALLHDPAESVAFLRRQLRPAVGAEPGRVTKLVADLGSDRFVVRERATAELQRLHDLAEPALAEALKNASNLEARRRIERLLEAAQAATPAPARLRQLRALEVLEALGTPESRQVLQALAGGAAASRLTKEAEASLRRLGRRALTSSEKGQ